MADDWFKLNMDIFGNRKIKYLRRLPNGDSIVLFWIALLSEARRCNSDGKVFLTESIPYTPDMLAEEFKFEESIVLSALESFNKLDMIHWDNGFITISGWEDHQNAEGLAKIREQTKKRVARHREKQNAQSSSVTCNATCNATVTQCNATEEDKDKEQDIEKDNKNISCQQVVDAYHAICTSFPKIRRLTPARSNAIKARLKSYSLDDFRKVFESAEASSFLKGEDGGWKASFDWLIKEANMVKVLEGNYADKPKRYTRKEPVPGWMPFTMGDAEIEAIHKLLNDGTTESVDNDPALAAEAEQLAQQMKNKYGRKDAG